MSFRHTKGEIVRLEGHQTAESIRQLGTPYGLSINCEITEDIAVALEPVMKELSVLVIEGQHNWTLEILRGTEEISALGLFNSGLEELEVLRKFSGLTELYIDEPLVTDITPVSSCEWLELLECGNSNIECFDSLLELPRLRSLSINDYSREKLRKQATIYIEAIYSEKPYMNPRQRKSFRMLFLLMLVRMNDCLESELSDMGLQ